MKNKQYLLMETIVLLSADLYQTIYDSRDDGNYGDVASEIIGLAKQFEKELDWKDDDSRDYITELEKFEKKVLDNLNKHN